MMKSMLFAALLALSAVPALAADNAAASKSTATPVSTDDARALAGKQIVARERAEAASTQTCSCSHGH